MSYKKTGLIPGKCPSEEVQNDFIENRFKPLKKEAKLGKIHLLFADPTHKIHNTINGKCWQTKGRAGTIMLPSNTGRRRITILGAINIIDTTKLTSIVTTDNCDQEMAQALLREIRNDYPDGKKIVIFKDNAAYHHAKSVQKLAEELNIQIEFLPAYSPNLNLIERIWKFMKSKFKNIYFDTFDVFHDAVCDFFGEFEKYTDDTATILNHKFQVIKEA